MPDSTILMDYALHRLASLINGLRVLPENIERNLWGSHGIFFSQRVLTTLIGKGLPDRKPMSWCSAAPWKAGKAGAVP